MEGQNKKRKRIFIFGQCTLHWGRMEFGNIGNYYIAKPMFEELRRVFPSETIVTTMQFSEAFCDQYNLKTVPMEWYYDFNSNNNLEVAKEEYEAACKSIDIESEFLKEIKKADLVIDFSGDIWGDNADFLGKDRFITGIYKDLTAQALKPTVLFSGSPGPFNSKKDIGFVKKCFEGFDLVINREHISTQLLQKQGFSLSRERDFACPSFLFQPAGPCVVKEAVDDDTLFQKDNPKIGVILCGWNFERGPFDVWPREEEEYADFVRMLENLIHKYHADIYLMSHSNGFEIPPAKFSLKHGRDFPIVQQLKNILDKRGYDSQVKLLEGIYTPEITKGIISNFDMLISGRIHGAVAGLSQGIPTVIIDYGHDPKAHKLRGFADVAEAAEFVADPNSLESMMEKTEKCFENRETIHKHLLNHMIDVKQSAREQFDYLKQLFNS